MSQNVLKLSPETFRSVFKIVAKDTMHWFPGHMNKGMKQMQHKLRSVDCLIEVHDARIPLTGRNVDFKYRISGIKPHILVLNKVDMIDKKYVPKIREKLRADYPNIVFTNCKDHRDHGVRDLFPLAQKLINASDRYNRENEEDYCVMIIGIPNVGKSSLTNALRNRFLHKSNASAVGAAPGITRSVLEKIKINEKPLFYMLDTPGILSPSIQSTEVGLKLALCNTIHEHLVGSEVLADFLLFWLNKHNHFEYATALKMNGPTDKILEVLLHIATIEKKHLKLRDSLGQYIVRPDFNSAAQLFIRRFRNLEFGKVLLDEDLL